MLAVRVLLAALLVAVLAAPAAVGQSAGPLAKYSTDPTTWRPASLPDPGVDARGDLGLSVPVMTVPGRGGLDYEVRFSYASGIRIDQPSSWVGGGWFFDPGSISRDVMGGVWVGSVDFNVDYTAAPTTQPDHYQVTLPGASSSMVWASSTTASALPPRRTSVAGSAGFYLTDFRAWRVEAFTDGQVTVPGTHASQGGARNLVTQSRSGGTFSNRNDYNRFVITTDDGVRYVFGAPTIATYDALHPAGRRQDDYVNTWRLEAILGTDYSATNLVPLGSEAGSWVLLKYSVSAVASTQDLGCGISEVRYVQTRYLTEVLTPTHSAVFATAGRSQEGFASYENGVHNKLSSITLSSRAGEAPATVLRTATLTTSNRFDSPTDPGECGGSGQRLALDGIQFAGAGGLAEPGYSFTYTPRVAGGTVRANRDHFGYYDTAGSWLGNFDANATDASAWSLASITYPTGGRDDITYENDRIDIDANPYGFYAATPNATAVGPYDPATNQIRQGGPRVTTIKRYDGIGSTAASQSTYTYGTGRLSGTPGEFFRFKYSNRAFASITERGRAAVYYDAVTRTDEDGSVVTTAYATGANVPQLETLVWDMGGAAVTLIQGNQDRNWGRVLSTTYANNTGATVRTVTRTLAHGQQRLAFARQRDTFLNQAGDVDVAVVWGFPDRATQVTTADRAGSLTATTTSAWTYFDTAGLETAATTGNGRPQRATVYDYDGRYRATDYTYAAQQYTEMRTANRLADVYQETQLMVGPAPPTSFVPGGSTTTYLAATARTFRSTSAGSRTLFLPHETRAWSAPAPTGTAPATYTAGASGWDLVETAATYNGDALPTAVDDARGTRTTLGYDAWGRLTSASVPSGVTTLARSFAYDAGNRLTSVTDENGRTSTWVYDGLGRLTQRKNASGTTVETIAYPGLTAGRYTLPFRVTSTRASGTTAAAAVTHVFFDGLGREVQTQELASGTATFAVTATVYFPATASLGRSTNQYIPYFITAGGGTHQTGYTGKAYARTVLLRDGTGRVYTERPAGTSAEVYHAHGVAAIDGAYFPYEEVTDEASHKTRAFADGWGHTFRTVEAYGTTLAATTHTVYDGVGQAVEVRPPNYYAPPSGSTADDWRTVSTFDTRGRMTTQATPDGETTRYKYDRAGALRYSQDADQAVSGRVAFTTYDAVGRPLLSGDGAATWSGLTNPDAVQAWETAAASTANAYDAKPTATGLFGSFGPEITAATQADLKGRLAGTASASGDGSQVELPGYDTQGRLSRRYTHTTRAGTTVVAGLYSTDLAYAYDLQDRMTRRTALVGSASARRFEHWYDYDARGLNTAVFTATTTAKPTAADVAYTYHPTAAVASVQYRTMAAVPYTYDARGRLTDIGGASWSTANVAGRPFVAHYDYNTDGTVMAAQFGHNTGGATGSAATYFKVAYAYDARHRLSSADYLEGGTSGAFPASSPGAAYDLAGITYDPNGNLTALQRRNGAGALADNLTYGYTPGTNRLASLTDAVAASVADWDADSGAFTHDRRGNPTALPAPYSAAVAYDYRSLPTAVTSTDGTRAAAYRYAASGQQYRREVAGGGANRTVAPGPTAPSGPAPAPAPTGGPTGGPTAAPTATPSGSPSADVAERPVGAPGRVVLGARPVPAAGAEAPGPDAAPSATSTASVAPSGTPAPSGSPWAAADTLDRADRAPARTSAPSRSASPWAAQPAAEPTPDAPAEAPSSGPAPVGSPAPETAPLMPEADLIVGATVQHLVLDGLPSGGLLPVVGTMALADPAAQEAQSSLDVTFNVLTPGGQVVGRALPGGTSRRFYHTDLLGTVRAVVTESGALAEHRAYDAWGVALAGRLVSPEAGTAEGFTGKPRLGGTATGGGVAALDDTRPPPPPH